jgi:acetyl esterase/lipase
MPHLDCAALVDPRLATQPPSAVLPGALSHFGLRYAAVQGWRPLQLDLHVPAAQDAGPEAWPVVVYVHGGSFLAGIPTMGPWTSLPAQGIAVASVSYRLSGEAQFPEPVEDVRGAVQWIAEHATRFGLDPERIALWGSSAGGYLAALVAITGSRPLGRAHHSVRTGVAAQVSAVVTHYPVTAPSHLRSDATLSTAEESRALAAVMAQFFDGSAPHVPTALADHLAAASHVPPFLVMHGDADRRVDLQQSRRLVEALGRHGVPADLVVIPGADHGAAEFESEPLVQRVVDFLHCNWTEATATPPETVKRH